MRKLSLSFLIIVGAVVLIGTGGYLWAQPPAISIDLAFNKTSYEFGEPVGVEVVVSNDSGKDLLISRGFSSKVYYLEIWIMDPAGRLLLGRRDGPHIEAPDAPPLPFVSYQGRLIQVARCEVLAAGWSASSQTNDLRAYYGLELPGYYTAQVKISAKVFKGQPGDPCDVHDYEWVGLLTSNMVSFYMEGSTEVHVVPNQWHLSWKDGNRNQDIQVQIKPTEGKTVADYRGDTIRLNNRVATRVEVLPSIIKAYFDAKEAVESLGTVELGQWYPVVISGRLKSNEPFGGSEKVRIHK